MTRFLRQIILFLLPALAVVGAGEAYVRSLPNPSKAKHTFLMAHADSLEVLVLGSSHTYYGVQPELLGRRAYSAAQVSQTLRYDRYVLERYPFRRLRTVVLPISDFTFYEDLEAGPEWYRASRYRLYMDCPYHSRLSRYGFEAAAPAVFAEKLKSLYTPPRMRWSAWGQGLEYTARNKPLHWDNGEERAATNRHSDLALAAQNVGHLEAIARRTEAMGARLVLVTTPLTASYRAHQDGAQLADVRRRLAGFMRRHPRVVFADFSNDPDFGPDDFYDADHLTTIGARKLTLKLLQRIP